MRSIGLDLEPWVKKGLLRFHNSRPTMYGLEMHLASMHKMIDEFEPRLVVVDPISNFMAAGSATETNSMLMRLVDFLKSRQITALLANLTHRGGALEQAESSISSLIDTWLLLRDIELNGERNRGLCILKSRGTAHSNQIREFLLTPHGLELTDVYLGPEGVLTGSARLAQEAREIAAKLRNRQEVAQKRRELERRHQAVEAQIAVLRLQYESDREEMERFITEQEARQERLEQNQLEIGRSRKADPDGSQQARKGARK
jgi:circadian clock protein KaiC